MILYDSQYQFRGISEGCLHKLGFQSYESFQKSANGDFANLLIHKNGYVYKFEYISWIEYIQQEDKRQALIVGGDGIQYQVTFDLEPFIFLNGDAGYLITIVSIVEYDSNEVLLFNNQQVMQEENEVVEIPNIELSQETKLQQVEEVRELHNNGDIQEFLLQRLVRVLLEMRDFIYELAENSQISTLKKVFQTLEGLAKVSKNEEVANLIIGIVKKEYLNIEVLVTDINQLYRNIEMLKLADTQETFLLDIKESISELNSSPLPDFIFQDILDSFIEFFDTSKEKIEESFNPEKIDLATSLIEEILEFSLSLNVEGIIQPLKNILSNIESGNIEYDRLIVDWIELSSFIDNIR